LLEGAWEQGGGRIALLLILTVAASLRFYEIGRSSLWFDEVVTMRQAREPSPSALLASLKADATRAPLHPILLQGWVRLLGPSDTSGRAFSAVCGILTVLLIARIGGDLYDARTGLWAAWLAALSPLLVQYSREARMYAWLALVACAAWAILISFSRGAGCWRRAAYVASLAALGYSHPLGLLMVAALGLASWFERSRLHLTTATWVAIHAAACLLITPWLPNYLDHEPDIASSRWLSPRYLIGLPIGYVGGTSVALLGCAALVVAGLIGPRVGRFRFRLEDSFAATLLLTWFAVPPLALYGYSLASHPIFGPARYTLFVGPAYLLLLGRGLARLPRPAAFIIAGLMAILSAREWRQSVYAPDLKADWRAAASSIRAIDPDGATIVVFSEDPRWSREVDVARYYLGPGFAVAPGGSADSNLLRTIPAPVRSIWFAVGLRGGRPVAELPGSVGEARKDLEFPGLRLIRRSSP
jgi:uncharacterized membrane protein